METNVAPDDDGQEGSLAAQYLRALLQRHGIAKHRRTPVIGDILGLGYHSAHRRLSSGPWTLEELQQVASHFGESLPQLVDPAGQPATFVVGPVRLPCRVALGGLTDSDRPAALVAVKGEREWIVMPALESIPAQSYDVKTMTIEPQQAKERRIAVLDDQPAIAESIAADLRDMGFNAQPFFAIEKLVVALKAQRYDAYIIDWVIGNTTAKKLITDIRAHDPFCLIAVLTGQLDEGEANEAEVAEMIAGENMLFYAKPLPVKIIAQRLKRVLGNQGAASDRAGR